MSELADIFSEFLFWFFAFFISFGAVGGWIVIVALLARERDLQRADIERATRHAETHPIVGRREAA